MGFRFRKSIKIAPGVKINLNKKSASVSIGPKGLKKTFSTSGRTTTTVGIPGTGISYSERSSSKAKRDIVEPKLETGSRPKKRVNRLKIAIIMWAITLISLIGSFTLENPASIIPGAILFFIIGLFFYKTKDKYKEDDEFINHE